MRVLAMMALGAVLLPQAAAAGELGDRPAAFRLHYDVAIAGFDVVSSVVRIDLAADGYSVDMRSETTGLPAWFTSWTSRLGSEGVRDAEGTPDSALFTSVTDKGEGPRRVEIAWDEDDQVAVTRTPPRRNQRVRPEEYVSASQLMGTVDPLAALLAVVVAADEGDACQGSIPVYDGKRRFDVQLSALPAEPDEAGIRCRVELLPIAGDFDDDRPNSFWRDPARRTAVVRLASPGEGLPALPVRVDAATSFGPLVVTMTAARALPVPESAALP
jgi:hypothetical protein